MSQPGIRRLAHWAKLLATVAAIIASLLTFPAAVPWMVAGWLAWHTVQVLRGRGGAAPVVVCAVVLLVKRVPWSWSLIALAVVATLLVGYSWWPLRRRRAESAETRKGGRRGAVMWGMLALLWLSWGVFTWDWSESASASRRPRLVVDRPVVCLGDSLTAAGYPALLAEKLSVPVADLSAEGNTTRDAIEQLPRLRKLRPQVVVVEIGGNDYVQGASKEETRANLQRIIAACRDLGAEVLLVEMPRGFVTDPYGGLERELARRDDLQLLSDSTIRWFVLLSPFAPPSMWLGREWHLSDDGLHPNARGSEALAASVAGALEQMYGPGILRTTND
jgi:acyl-CoA thioesterase-1